MAEQAGASGVPLTPQMIEAGVEMLEHFTSDEHRCFPDEDIVLAIFRAMAENSDIGACDPVFAPW